MLKKTAVTGASLALIVTSALAQTEPDIVSDITSGVTAAQGIFTTVIGVAVTIFVARLALKWARKGS